MIDGDWLNQVSGYALIILFGIKKAFLTENGQISFDMNCGDLRATMAGLISLFADTAIDNFASLHKKSVHQFRYFLIMNTCLFMHVCINFRSNFKSLGGFCGVFMRRKYLNWCTPSVDVSLWHSHNCKMQSAEFVPDLTVVCFMWTRSDSLTRYPPYRKPYEDKKSWHCVRSKWWNMSQLDSSVWAVNLKVQHMSSILAN